MTFTLTIKTPEQLEGERTELMKKAIDLLNKHARSEERYARRMQHLMYKIRQVERRLNNG